MAWKRRLRQPGSGGCLAFDANDSGKLYSTSYDNTVRCLDAGAMRFTDVFSGDEDNAAGPMSWQSKLR